MPDLICEHCGAHLSLRGMPMDGLNAEWRCPKCNGIITEESWNKAKAWRENEKQETKIFGE